MSNRKTKPDDFLKLPYSRIIIPDTESGTFTAEILEFPGCIAQGDTPDETFKNLEKVARSWLEAAIDLGQDIPSPHLEREYRGQYPLRLPKSMHRQISLAADMDGTSINQFIIMALSEKLGAVNLYSRLVKQLSENMKNFELRINKSIELTAINSFNQFIGDYTVQNISNNSPKDESIYFAQQ